MVRAISVLDKTGVDQVIDRQSMFRNQAPCEGVTTQASRALHWKSLFYLRKIGHHMSPSVEVIKNPKRLSEKA
jgi:hypothetical protein